MQDKDKLYKSLANTCAKREQSPFDIRKKLNNKKIPIEIQNEIISKLKQENFINENRYAQLYINDKFKLNGWGKIKIKYQLRAKQIDENIINQNINNIPEEKYKNKCKDLAINKLKQLKNEVASTKKTKLIRFLTGRGFETDVILSCINNFFE